MSKQFSIWLVMSGRQSPSTFTRIWYTINLKSWWKKFKERFHHQNEASVYSEPKNDLGKTVWLKFEVTNEVTDEKNRKKSSVFKGFRRQGVKSTASRLHVAHRSSPSAKFYSLYRQTAVWRYFYMLAAKASCSVYRAGGLYFLRGWPYRIKLSW